MKKFIALLLAAVMCISLVACGNEATKNVNDTENYIGVWQTESYRLTLTKGGVGRYEDIFDNGTGYYDLDWEVKDGVLITQISFMGMEHKAVLELSEDMNSLVVL